MADMKVSAEEVQEVYRRIKSGKEQCSMCRGKGQRLYKNEYWYDEWGTCNVCNGFGFVSKKPTTR